jgi:endonuclease/exonuclease/phosphatase family metal-dependent hydrolase
MLRQDLRRLLSQRLEHLHSRSILGLLGRLLWLRRRIVAPVVVLALVFGFVAMRACPGPSAQVRVATFNIRSFPEHPQQVEAAFAVIADLDVPIVAVQEIMDPHVFTAAALRTLGPNWRTEFGPWRDEDERRLLPGVLYDNHRYQLDYTRLHRQTRIDGFGRPMLEVRLLARGDGPTLRVFVVHLQAGGSEQNAVRRRAQLQAVTPILRHAAAGNDEVVMLGDFNSTGDADRDLLRGFARATELHWASEELACTSYWKPDGKCHGSALDHVFTSRPASETTARGPCESVGCVPGDRCPIFYDEVSDHCPVTATF